MKLITLLLPIALLLVIPGCKSESNDSGSNRTQKQSNEYTMVDEGPVYTFTVVPDQYDNCTATFAQSEDELSSGRYIFATDLRKSCVIALDGRLVQIDLATKQTSNLSAQFYKFDGKGYTIDLEIRKSEKVGPRLKKVRGQIRVYGHDGFRDIFYVIGEVKC